MSNFEFLFDGEPVSTKLEREGEILVIAVGDETLRLQPIAPNEFTARIDGRTVHVAAAKEGETFYVDIDSVLIELTEPSQDGGAAGGGDLHGEKDKIFAPMPGKVVKIMVAVGDEVTDKQPMVIVEAMKMENQVNARAAGTVKAVNFAAGDQVDTETPIIELDIDE